VCSPSKHEVKPSVFSPLACQATCVASSSVYHDFAHFEKASKVKVEIRMISVCPSQTFPWVMYLLRLLLGKSGIDSISLVLDVAHGG
jgi:hypothetical protein